MKVDWRSRKKQSNSFRPAPVISVGFLLLIFLGTFLLVLPVSSAKGTATSLVDALFTATTSVCVTGLTVVSTADDWSLFGQGVILILIQLGGLGVVTSVMTFMLVFHRRIGLKNRMLIQAAYGWNSMYGVSHMISKIVRGTLLVELAGAACYMMVLVPKNGRKGVWDAVFLSVSAFCNAGMDTMGNSSLSVYRENVWMNIVTMVLIILGGLGFLVWWEILALLRGRREKKIPLRLLISRMSLHTKMVLIATFVCILAGTIVVFLCEFHNPETLGMLSVPQKFLAALFQSVTTRTAGFFTISQSALEDDTSVFCMLLMFIGGSPGGTAGGVKTVTVAMVLCAVMAAVKGREETRVFHRSISDSNVKKGLAVIMLSLTIWIVMTMLLSCVEDADFMKISYETMSAIGTVGLSKDLTPMLHVPGKLILCVMMYLGRIGPITLAASFLSKGQSDDFVHFPEENIMLG
ncbi:MAG: TrkH family potassium uptake protein [Eubacteriales bacterium]|nr:TrkH family potassium uptake protein [Eubacteriales bacterium]